jgi:DNA repair exonuclease SbcCD nuclease subunit
MKIIHSADIHLGAPISNFPKHVSDERKREVRNTFLRMVDFARQQGVKVIMLSGDVFDRDKPYKKDVDFFYGVVEKNPDIDFLYLRGNHDQAGEERALPNLKIFSSAWQSYTYGELVISGIEILPENSSSLYSTLSLDVNKKNIVMLHGQLGGEINLTKLRDKNIDYLALGHIHEYSEGEIDRRGRYAYSGCLQGRGFDETGVKGFVLLSVEDKISYEFIPFSQWGIEKCQLDVSGLSDSYSVYLRAKAEIPFKKDSIYRVELVGEIDAEVEMDAIVLDVTRSLSASCAHVRIKDKTKKKIDYTAYDGDNSLKGEFVRTVRESGEYTEEQKAQIIAYGLKALAGREVDA